MEMALVLCIGICAISIQYVFVLLLIFFFVFAHSFVSLQKVATLVILLAGVLACTAHDSYSTVNTEGWSTTQSTASHSEKSSYLDAAENQSVVVNWLLVCEDLCG